MRSADHERGAIGPFVIGIFLAMVLMAGLVVDGGLALNARQRVTDNAEQAARVGANQIDESALRASGEVVLNPGAAEAEAAEYLATLGYSEYNVNAGGDEVTVTVRHTVDTQLISIMGIGSFEVEGSATARAAAGIVGEIP